MSRKRTETSTGETRPIFLVEPENGVPDVIQFGKPAMPALFQLVEITDRTDRPLMCMTPEAAHKQKLFFRMVCVALYSQRRTLFLYRRAESTLEQQGCWDLFSGATAVGEAREDAALRLLAKKTGLEGLTLAARAAKEGDNALSAHVTLFAGTLSKGSRPSNAAHTFMEVDADELEGLVRDIPELLSPSLLWAFAAGFLVPGASGQAPSSAQ